jgi:LysM repeat protein
MTQPLMPTPVPTNTGSEPQGGPSNQANAGGVAASGRTHTVQQGESLALLAQYYKIEVDNLVAANTAKYPRLKTNPNVIVVGWVLSIPEN